MDCLGEDSLMASCRDVLPLAGPVRPNLTSFPPNVITAIISSCDWHTGLRVRQTCKYLAQLGTEYLDLAWALSNARKKGRGKIVHKILRRVHCTPTALAWLRHDAGGSPDALYSCQHLATWVAEHAAAAGDVATISWLLGMDNDVCAVAMRQQFKNMYDIVWLHAAAGAAGGGKARLLSMLTLSPVAPGQPHGLRRLAPCSQSILLKAAVRACVAHIHPAAPRTAQVASVGPCLAPVTRTMSTSLNNCRPTPTPTSTPATSRAGSLLVPLTHCPPPPGSLLPVVLQLCTLQPEKPLPWQPPHAVDSGALGDALQQAAAANAVTALRWLVDAEGGNAALQQMGGKIVMDAATAGNAEVLQALLRLPVVGPPAFEEQVNPPEGWANVHGRSLNSALSLAMDGGYVGTVEVLLSAGARVALAAWKRLVTSKRTELAIKVLRSEPGQQAHILSNLDAVRTVARDGTPELLAAMVAAGMDSVCMGVALEEAAHVHSDVHLEMVRVLLSPPAGPMAPEPQEEHAVPVAQAHGLAMVVPRAPAGVVPTLVGEVVAAPAMVEVEVEVAGATLVALPQDQPQHQPPAHPTEVPSRLLVPQLPQQPHTQPERVSTVLEWAARAAEERNMPEGSTLHVSMSEDTHPYSKVPTARAQLQQIVAMLLQVACAELSYKERVAAAVAAAREIAATGAMQGQADATAVAAVTASMAPRGVVLNWSQVLCGAMQARDRALVARLLNSRVVSCKGDDEDVLWMAGAVCAADGDASYLLLLVEHGLELRAALNAAHTSCSLSVMHHLLVAAAERHAAETAGSQPSASVAQWDDVLGWLTLDGALWGGYKWVACLSLGGDRLVEAVARTLVEANPCGTAPNAATAAMAHATLCSLLHTHGGRPGAALLLPTCMGDCVSQAHMELVGWLLEAFGGDVVIGGGPHSPDTVGFAFARAGATEALFTMITHGASADTALHALVADPSLPDRMAVVQRLLAGVPRVGGGAHGEGPASVMRADPAWQDGLVVREAAGLGDTEMTGQLLAAGACVHAALLMSVRAGQRDTVLHLMEHHGASPAWRGYFAVTAAAERKDLRLLEAMLGLVEMETGGLSPAALTAALDGCVVSGHLRGVRMLVDVYGADPVHSDNQPVRQAAQAGRTVIVDVLLGEYGADPQAALSGAVLGRQLVATNNEKEAQMDVIKWLISGWGARPEGEAMSLALEAGDEPLVSQLLELEPNA